MVSMTNADISKAKRMLKYQPKVRMEEGIKRFVEWYKKEKEIVEGKAYIDKNRLSCKTASLTDAAFISHICGVPSKKLGE